MTIDSLKNELVAVLGFGKEGQATTKYLIKHGIKPVLFDHRPWKEWPAKDQDYIKSLGVNFIFGPDAFLELAGFNVAFRSPGIKTSDVERSVPIYRPIDKPINGHATYQGLILTSQAKWFFEHCPAKIIGVTGTKGKGTAASLIYEILKSQAKSYLTGNIGKIQPLEILDNLTADDWVVYELSSFQLQDLDKSPHIGVVLMTTSEHLDYHKDNQEYIDAKSAITKFQTEGDFAIINADYPSSIKIGEQGKGKKVYFSRKKPVSVGCFVDNNKVVIANSGFQLPISNFQLRGAHNLENICASIAAAFLLKINPVVIQKSVDDFKGLEHRLEFVAEKQGIHPVKSGEAGSGQSQRFNGVKFYNDSYSTTPETAIAAINSFKESIIVILGGSSKNSDFTDLGRTLLAAPNIKALILIGQEAGRIKSVLGGVKKMPFQLFENAKSMQEIFEQIKSIAKPGDIVLLSPACASFGMFQNYEDRGNQFKQLAKTF